MTFRLENKPPRGKSIRPKFANNGGTQLAFLTGRDCLPGQQDLFDVSVECADTRQPPVITLEQKPTADMPEGNYEVVQNGKWCGRYVVTTNWCGERYVAYADADFLPAMGPAPDPLS